MSNFPNESGETAYALVSALIDHLVDRGILSKVDVVAIRKVASDNLVTSPSNQARGRAAAFLIRLNTTDE